MVVQMHCLKPVPLHAEKVWFMTGLFPEYSLQETGKRQIYS